MHSSLLRMSSFHNWAADIWSHTMNLLPILIMPCNMSYLILSYLEARVNSSNTQEETLKSNWYELNNRKTFWIHNKTIKIHYLTAKSVLKQQRSKHCSPVHLFFLSLALSLTHTHTHTHTHTNTHAHTQCVSVYICWICKYFSSGSRKERMQKGEKEGAGERGTKSQWQDERLMVNF